MLKGKADVSQASQSSEAGGATAPTKPCTHDDMHQTIGQSVIHDN